MGITLRRSTGRILAAVGAACVLGCVVLALLVTFRSGPSAEREEAPPGPAPRDAAREERTAAVARARTALRSGDPVAAAKALSGEDAGESGLRAEVARALVLRARRAGEGWKLEDAEQLLDLALRVDPGADETRRAAAEQAERAARVAEIEHLLDTARTAGERGDFAAAIEAATAAAGLEGPPELASAAAGLVTDLEAEHRRRMSRQEALAEASSLLDQGKVARARRLLEDYRATSGDRSLDGRTAALREIEEAGGADGLLPARRALRWLAAHQDPKDGAFHGATYDDRCDDKTCRGMSPSPYDPGVTGLALMAFTAYRRFDLLGEFGDPAGRAAEWLVSQVSADGAVLGTHYNASIVALALFERAVALGEPEPGGEDPAAKERDAGRRILAYLAGKGRLADGGWRYSPGNPESDTSVTCWVLQAFHAGAVAGVSGHATAIAGGLSLLETMADASGQVDYIRGRGGRPNMNACALYVRLLFGEDPKRDPLARVAGVRRAWAKMLLEPDAKWERADFYGLYYTTYALELLGGRDWQRWGPAMVAELIRRQETKGHAAGSFQERRGMGARGGRLYATSMAALTLMAWYRHRADGTGDGR